MAHALSAQSDGKKTGEPSFKYNDSEETQNVQSRASESPQNQGSDKENKSPQQGEQVLRQEITLGSATSSIHATTTKLAITV